MPPKNEPQTEPTTEPENQNQADLVEAMRVAKDKEIARLTEELTKTNNTLKSVLEGTTNSTNSPQQGDLKFNCVHRKEKR